jgi:hypothetical protein
MVALSDRDEVDEFCVQLTVVNPELLPLVGEMLSQELLSDVLQLPPWHPLGDPVMVTG